MMGINIYLEGYELIVYMLVLSSSTVLGHFRKYLQYVPSWWQFELEIELRLICSQR